MISANDHRPLADFLREYQRRLTTIYPDKVQSWPLLDGWNLVSGMFKDWRVVVIKDAPFTMETRQTGFEDLSESATGASNITPQDREFVRGRLEQFFNITSRDAILLWPPDNILDAELEAMFRRHEL
jgi:hypothetical protein